jgi:integrase
MPVKPLMTYRRPRKGWVKKYKGQFHAVSCRQLGCEPTEAGSVVLANEWWREKQAEIDALEPDIEAEFLEVKRDYTLERLAMVSQDEPLDIIQALGGLIPESKRKFVAQYLRSAVLADIGDGPKVETDIGKLIDAWEESKEKASETGDIHPTRLASYRADAAKFRTFFAGQGIADASAIGPKTVDAFGDYLDATGLAGTTKKNILLSFRQFVHFIHRRDAITALPKNLDDKVVGLGEPNVKTFRLSELREILEFAKSYGDGRVYLYLLIMLNCGFYQSDVSELTYRTVSLKKGVILKARSKTGKYKVRYALWPETIAELRKHRNRDKTKTDKAGNVLYLVNANGGELVPDCEGRIDNIASAYWNMRRAWAKKKAKEAEEQGGQKKKIEPVKALALKYLRKTGTTILSRHKTFRYFTCHYLADSPRGMEARHYRRPSNQQFAAALAWLRIKILGDGTK